MQDRVQQLVEEAETREQALDTRLENFMNRTSATWALLERLCALRGLS